MYTLIAIQPPHYNSHKAEQIHTEHTYKGLFIFEASMFHVQFEVVC